jgi:hypothetical protein
MPIRTENGGSLLTALQKIDKIVRTGNRLDGKQQVKL